jgi:hypothetical protein
MLILNSICVASGINALILVIDYFTIQFQINYYSIFVVYLLGKRVNIPENKKQDVID